MLKNKFFWIGLLLILSVMIFLLGYLIRDQQNYLDKISGMNSCLRDDQLPCRWIQDSENPFGYPLFNYLAPLPYIFGQLIFYISKSLMLALNLMFIVPVIGIYFFVNILANKFLGQGSSSLLTFFFSLATFTLFSLREELGGLWAIMFLIAIFHLILLIEKKATIRNFLLLSISLGFLFISHNFLIAIFLTVIPIVLITIFKKKKAKFILTILTGLLLGLILSAFYVLPSILEKNLIGRNFLPIDVLERSESYENDYEILTGETKVTNFKKGSNWLSFKAESSSHTIIRLSLYYFPVWKVFVDGQEIKIEYKDNNMGLISFILGKGNHLVEARLYNTLIRTLSNLLTLGGVGITFILFLLSFVKFRQWLLYYKKGIN